jgi:cyclophilin family peptidyl-prolyl cis-trans isomerase
VHLFLICLQPIKLATPQTQNGGGAEKKLENFILKGVRHLSMAPNRNRRANRHKSHGKMWLAIGIIAIIIVIVGVYFSLANPSSPATIAPTKVLLQTTAGNITIDLRTDKPITSGNFINLVKEGKYDGTPFYRTMAGFMIQGGQVSGNVPTIKDEIGNNNRNAAYTIAMAKTSQPNSATSEFFINVEDNGQKYAPSFDATYTVFGTVISGKDVVDAIANAPATENPNNPSEISSPVNPVTIIKASIVT